MRWLVGVQCAAYGDVRVGSMDEDDPQDMNRQVRSGQVGGGGGGDAGWSVHHQPSVKRTRTKGGRKLT